jgi:hypothetical protein
MIWITVQVLMIGLDTWLHPLYFGVGLAILLSTLGRPVKQCLHQPPNNRGDI